MQLILLSILSVHVPRFTKKIGLDIDLA